MLKQGLIRSYDAGAQEPRIFTEDVENIDAIRKRKTQPAQVTAMQALTIAKRLERELEDIKTMLRIESLALGVEEQDVVGMYALVCQMAQAQVVDDRELWVRKLLAIDETYLQLVEMFTGNNEPWVPYLALSQVLRASAYDERSRAMAEYMQRNLRNVAVLYAKRNDVKSKLRFEEGTVASRLLKTILSNPDPRGSSRIP